MTNPQLFDFQLAVIAALETIENTLCYLDAVPEIDRACLRRDIKAVETLVKGDW